MKKVTHRTLSVFLLVAVLAAGMCFYIIRFVVDGEKWATFKSNGNVYSGGVLSSGTITDRNGEVLLSIEDGVASYSEDKTTRISTLHAVGDIYGNIGTGAVSAFASKLTGYDLISGTYSFSGNGGTVDLTIDSELNNAAYEALDGRSGCVAVMNYKTGELLCMVSSPSFDPKENKTAPENIEGAYINRFISSKYTPGSVFKLVTVAAIENIDDIYDRSFHCDGQADIGGGKVTCTRAHGDLKIEDALAVSCNCVFAELAIELGADTLEEYANKAGLTEEFEIDGIKTASGSFEKAENNSINLAWSGVGQYNNMVNPAAMLRYVSAIANGGETAEMRILKSNSYSKKERLLSSDTAEKIESMMDYCTEHTYGSENFPNLDLCAKSGTAEVGNNARPHAWFVGFINNENSPLAFVVVVENGGWGSTSAGAVANTVLQAALER